MSEAMYIGPEGEREPPSLNPLANIAAELDAALREFDRVMYDEGDKMSGESLSRLSNGIRIIFTLNAALR